MMLTMLLMMMMTRSAGWRMMLEQRGRGQLLAHFGATVRKQLPPTTAQCSMNTFSWLQHYTCTNKSKNLHHHYCSSDFLSKKWVFALSESPDLQHTPHTPLTQGCNRQYLIFTLFNQYIHFCRRCIGFDTNACLRLTIFGWWEEARGEKVLQPWVWASVVSSYSVACSSNHANWLLIPNFCSVHQMVNVPLSLQLGSMYFWSWLNSIEQEL